MTDTRTALNAALKEAMLNKDNRRRDVIRLTLSAVKQVETDTRQTLDDAGVIAVLQKEAKKRRESIDELTQAGRDASDEAYELSVIEEFLPAQMSYDEVKAVVQEVVAAVGATSPKEIGKVMGPVMARLKGLADGALINQVVKDVLSG